MKFASLSPHTDDSFILRLDPGDVIHDTIHQFCSENGISNATLEGIGSVDSPIIAYFSTATKQFQNKSFEGFFEVTSLLGNVALVDDRAFAHIHIMLSGSDMQVYGGHLVNAVCGATLEIVVKSFSTKHQKIQKNSLGLYLWYFEDN